MLTHTDNELLTGRDRQAIPALPALRAAWSELSEGGIWQLEAEALAAG